MTPSVRCLSNRWPATALSYPDEHHRGSLVYDTSTDRRRLVFPRLFDRGCGARSWRHCHHRDGGPRRLRHGGRTGDREIRRRHARSSHGQHGGNGGFALPPMSFAGTPAGIDARKVVDTGFSRLSIPGLRIATQAGQIGAGITRAPLDCFTKAVTALASTVPDETP